MTVKTGTAWAGLFVTLDATGAKATPSVGPAGVLYVDGVANGASVTITGSNPYKFAVTLPSLTAGQRVDMYITATIATIATAAVVASEQADTALLSEVKTDTAAILADTGTDGVVVASIATDAITAAAIKADAIAEIADGVLDEAMAGHVGAGTLGKAIADTLEDTGTSIPADLVDIENKIDVIATDTTTEIPASITALDGKIDTIDNFLDTEVAAILADTNELQTDLVNGGRLDLLIDGIKAKTDTIPASPAAVGSAMTLANNAITAAVIATDAIDADAIKADAVTKLQTGITASVDATSIRSAIGMASADLDTQLDTLAGLVGSTGTGDKSWTYTVAESDGTPIPDVTVWVTSDIAGTTVLAQGTTNASGQVTFLLNDGATVYVWAKKFGWTFTNPDIEVVS